MIRIKLLKSGNEKIFMEMVRLYTPQLRSWLSARLYGHDAIDDLLQEIFIAAFNAKNKLYADSNLEAWLKGIARNKLLLYYRTQSRRLKMTESFLDFITTSMEDEELDVVQHQDHSILKKCLEKLPPQLKDFVTQRHFNGVKVQDLAKENDCSESQISVNLFRARQKLRTCLEFNR